MSLTKFVQARARNDRGAVAVLVAMVAIVLFGMAAMAVDITHQVNQRQELHDTIDEAVHAGAYDLPGTSAEATAIAFAKSMDANSNPTAKLYCVVASVPLGGSYVVDANQIPGTCNPGLPPYNVGKYGSDLKCNSQICKIPCYPASGGQCNTIFLAGQKPVGFGFARALGINQGNTGTVSTAACKGLCGRSSTNPLDLVVVGDRTGSMGSGITALRDAVMGMLTILDPNTQQVALGTIGESASPANGNGNVAPPNCLSKPASAKASGLWVPVGFSKNYLNADTSVNTTTSPLGMAARCLGDANSGTGTYLAAPFRTARDVIKQSCQPSYCDVNGLPPRAGVKKAIIFMTDGEPNEQSPPGNGLPWSSNGNTACNNVKAEATAAKAEGTIVATIAFRLDGVECSSNGQKVTEVLAGMASDAPATAKVPGPSLDDGGDGPGGFPGGCQDAGHAATSENSDGDYFFCTPSTDELKSLFKVAVSQITGSIRLLRLP